MSLSVSGIVVAFGCSDVPEFRTRPVHQHIDKSNTPDNDTEVFLSEGVDMSEKLGTKNRAHE